MKINKLKINEYGKLKEKEINLEKNINIIYGENEAGKSTLLSFIINSFYGISRNKNGKEISDFEKYTPWIGEDFSGKLEYELDNQERFEIFRDFKKRNPRIFNEKMEDISKEFNIDKNKGNEFFYEQTKIDEELFLSTIVVNQQEVRLGKQEQNVLIQKIANLVGTGEDNVSFKRAMDRINRRILDEIGTQRSREKPINILSKEIKELENEKQELENYSHIKYEIEEKRNQLLQEIERLNNENKILKEKRLKCESEKIENEKINIKIDLKNENDEKIKEIKDKIDEINRNNKNIFENNKKIKIEKNKLNKKIIFIFIWIIVINILSIILLKNNYFRILIFLTVPVDMLFSYLSKNKIKKKEFNLRNNLEKINTEINSLNYQMDLLERNNIKLKEEIDENKIRKKEINILEDMNKQIQNIENLLNNKKIELHTLQLDYQNIEPKIENISRLEEKIINNNEKMVNFKKLEKSMNLAKEVLENSYEKMKNTITPKFTDRLSEIIGKITKGKYTKVRLNDENGLVVELDNGNYMPASRLSLGTMDQLYLSLRLAMVEELSEEKMPIILDEVFAYYDTQRLKNILKYIVQRFSEHQIIIFTCTNREKEALEELNLEFNNILLKN